MAIETSRDSMKKPRTAIPILFALILLVGAGPQDAADSKSPPGSADLEKWPNMSNARIMRTR